jgi:hypothetical protein
VYKLSKKISDSRLSIQTPQNAVPSQEGYHRDAECDESLDVALELPCLVSSSTKVGVS